jgi:hypothetical protein
VQLKGYTDAKSLPEFVDAVDSYQETVKKATVTAYAEAIASKASLPLFGHVDVTFLPSLLLLRRGDSCELLQKLCF